jgi:cell shape-determining protein MreC
MRHRFYRTPRPEGAGNTLRSAVIALSIALIIFAADYASGGLIRGQIRSGGVAVQTLAANVSSVFSSGYFSSHRALARKNQELQDALRTREDHDALLRTFENDIALMHEAARLASEIEGSTVPVRSSLRSSPYGTFLIGAGSNQGINVGDPVLSVTGYVLGTVVNVSAEAASVKMLFAADNEIEMVTNDVAFQANGRGGGRARAEVNRDAPVSDGDLVYAPEISESPAGVIGKVEADASNALKVVYLYLPLNVHTLRYVYVASQ